MINKLKFGRVAIVGRPNTGKSTLLNALMNQKVAITSPLPQTTRKSSQVVFRNEKGVIVFTDTPGIINQVEDLMSKNINLEAPKSTARKDVIVCLVDISREKSEEENKVIGLVRKMPSKKILVYNKTDKAIGTKDHLAEYNYLEEEFDKVISISAIKEKNVKGLLNLIFDFLPEKTEKEINSELGVMAEKKGLLMGMGSREYIGEIIREKAYLFLREELPYTINVEVKEVKDKGKLIYIKAVINTNADRYKKMIIGKNGQKIKEIGFNARKELELMSGRKVFLEMTVEIDRHWMERSFNA
ncbi:GTPase Era [Candidatus Shapirobacteria bacterium]|nr:GTPase Era [Candidatus Shapirobacteria bacterium]